MIAFTGQEGLNASHLLGPDGLIAGQWADFEFRSEQLEMARAVQAALREGYHLVVEAGTGIGKSFAYLAGAIDRALRQKTKVVISTYTINLQEQLIGKDIPFLQAILPEQFTARLAKGRNHYLCKRRLEYAIKRQMNLFEDEGAALTRIAEWARDTPDGSLSDLPFIPPPHVWQAVQSEHGNCKGRKCPYFSKCFYGRMRRQLETADIIVANHALLFSDLVLKQSGAGVLPDYQSVILDEAHNIEHVAEDHFGIRISQFSIAYLLDHLFEPRKRKGILAFQHNAEKARSLVKTCRQAMQLFFAQVQAWFAHAGDERNGRCEAEFVQDNLSTPVKALRLCLSKLAKHTKDEDERYEILRYAERLAVLESDIKDFLFQRKEACVYWVEVERNRYRRIVLRCAPLDVGPYLKSSLFDTCQSVVLTSATLSCGPRSEGGFAFFSNRIGLETFTALQLGSPFHYEEQVTLYIETDLPPVKRSKNICSRARGVPLCCLPVMHCCRKPPDSWKAGWPSSGWNCSFRAARWTGRGCWPLLNGIRGVFCSEPTASGRASMFPAKVCPMSSSCGCPLPCPPIRLSRAALNCCGSAVKIRFLTTNCQWPFLNSNRVSDD
jgi:ATP-dependent DNA helicase DinG